MSKLTLQTLDLSPWPLSQRNTVLLGIAIPVALPAVWALWRQYSVTSRGRVTSRTKLPSKVSSTKATAGLAAVSADASTTTDEPQRPVSMPVTVPDASVSQFYERVAAKPVLAENLPPSLVPGPGAAPSALLTAFIRRSMLAHSRTFVGKAIEKKLSTDRQRTCQPEWISNLNFQKGDLVNGTYRVVYRGPSPGEKQEGGSERIELALEIPDGWDGPKMEGFVVVSFEEAHPKMTDTKEGGKEMLRQFNFTNELWMWNGSPKAFFPFDHAFMRWFHSITTGWLVLETLDGLKIKGTKSKV
jgi:hypothetical protein